MSSTVTEMDRDQLLPGASPPVYSSIMKIWTAFFYACSSLLITIVNKTVLTSYEFPSYQVLAMGQMLTTVVVLFVGKQFNVIKYPDFNSRTVVEISPLPLIYLGNMVFGLGGTKELSLPMFTMLRRFAILMTMIAEFYVLNIRPKLSVKISVALMIIGAMIAAGNDLGFNFEGYCFVLANDFLTAANCVFTKKKLNTQKEMGKYGLMFYCAVLMLPLSVLLNFGMGELQRVCEFEYWSDAMFIIQFLLSCTMGFILNYSVMLCTQYNSALTTTIMGCLKNILVTYLGMFIGGDYKYSLTNFLGINLSIIGSLIYTFVTFRPAKPAPSDPVHVVTHGK
ncbi:hypothetical protein J6590_011818 [Homalodisca vitripennis]|nr:hypothetical protein J6590_011818 [Homalodisca vitripennis]